MLDLYNTLPVYFIMAAVGTSLFLIKLCMLFFTGDLETDIDTELHTDFDGDLDGDLHADSDAQFTLISVQSILAFLMGAGWLGLAARSEWKWEQTPSLIAALAFGLLMMLMSSYLSFKMKGLNSKNMRVDYGDAIGLSGQAYTNIPKKGQGLGQIQIDFKGKQQVLQALTDIEDLEEIKAFAKVEVIDAAPSGTLTVKKI